MMENELYKLFDDISESELTAFDSSLENAAKTLREDKDISGRIAREVLGKAGYDMKNTNEKAKLRSFAGRKKAAALLIAAAMTLAAGGTAAAVGLRFAHKQNVVRQYGYAAADLLEDAGAAANITAENEHFRVTCDSIISNGQGCEMLFTFEALDDAGRKVMDDGGHDLMPNICGKYKSSGRAVNDTGGLLGVGALFYINETLPEYTRYFNCYYDPDEAADDNEIVLTFGTDPFGYSSYGVIPELEGIEMTINASESLGTMTFADESGYELKMNIAKLNFTIDPELIKSPVYEETRMYKSLFVSFTDINGNTTEPQPVYTNYTKNNTVYYQLNFRDELFKPDSYTAVTVTDINGEVITRFKPVG